MLRRKDRPSERIALFQRSGFGSFLLLDMASEDKILWSYLVLYPPLRLMAEDHKWVIMSYFIHLFIKF